MHLEAFSSSEWIFCLRGNKSLQYLPPKSWNVSKLKKRVAQVKISDVRPGASAALFPFGWALLYNRATKPGWVRKKSTAQQQTRRFLWLPPWGP